MAGFRIKLNTKELRRAAEAARTVVPQAMDKRVTQFIAGGTALLKAGIKESAPVFQGKLANSIRESVTGSILRGEPVVRGQVFSSGAAAVYADVVDRGRKPGTFPNVGALRRYVDLKIKRGEISVDPKKLFPGRKTRPKKMEIVNTLAFLIGRKIKQRGTKAKRYVKLGVNRKRAKINRLADILAELLAKDVAAALGK